MKRRSAFLTFAACALMAAHTPAEAAADKSSSPSPSPAQSAVERLLRSRDFSTVQVVTFKDNANLGFFDRKTGKLYIYNSDLTKCIAVKQWDALGEPAKSINHS
jgi:hypothetical protein